MAFRSSCQCALLGGLLSSSLFGRRSKVGDGQWGAPSSFSYLNAMDRQDQLGASAPYPDKSSLSLLPALKCTAPLSLAFAEIQPYWAVGTGITPFRRISNLPTSPTGTSAVAFRAWSHSA